MNLPNFRRGVELTSTELNKLSDGIRSAAVTSVIGGTYMRTPGGTTLIIDQQVRGGSTEAGGVACPFQVTDVTENTTLKVQIQWGLVMNMLPTGMFPDNDPPLIMTVTETCYVYCKIVFDINTLLVTAVSFSLETDLKTNTSNTQYNLIAVVTVNDDDQQKKFFSSIKNICLQPFPSPCSLTS
jgi:hypothetical protein